MLNSPFGQQQKPPLFPVIDELENHVHPLVRYVLAVILAIGGYFWGIGQDSVPVVLPVAVGFILGLLLVKLLLKLTGATLGLLIVASAGLVTFWLLANDARLKGHQPLPTPAVQQAAPSSGPSLGQRIARLLREADL